MRVNFHRRITVMEHRNGRVFALRSTYARIFRAPCKKKIGFRQRVNLIKYCEKRMCLMSTEFINASLIRNKQ